VIRRAAAELPTTDKSVNSPYKQSSASQSTEQGGAGAQSDMQTANSSNQSPTSIAQANSSQLQISSIPQALAPHPPDSSHPLVTSSSIPPRIQASDQPEPQITDCAGFGKFIQGITQLPDDETSLFGSYFNSDLSKVSDQTMDDLIGEAKVCGASIQQQASQFTSSDLAKRQQLLFLSWAIEEQGVFDLQRMKNMHDAAASAAAAAQQNIIDTQKNSALIADLPTCSDSGTISHVENAVSNSPAGKVGGLALLALKNIGDISGPSNMGYRVCQADALFNNGEREIVYKINWFDKSQNMLSISVENLDPD